MAAQTLMIAASLVVGGLPKTIPLASRPGICVLAETTILFVYKQLNGSVSAFCASGPECESPTFISRNLVFNGT
jgi:hypothetical protein